MTLAQIRNAVDAKLAGIWPAVQARQAAFLAANGRYWQGKRTHVVTPSEGVETAANNLADRPTNEAAGWTGLPAAMPMVLTMDVYEASGGHGYVASVRVSVLGTTYERAQAVGPEAAARTFAWRIAT